jgi:hypothetical protein|tara:strand:+ start:178 stop:630 length:453 start_codon:yes stop_codon:yes gene_type:complete
MGYNRRNTGRTGRIAASKKADTQGDLHLALADINSAKRNIKDLNKQIVSDEKSNKELRMLGYYGKMKADDRELKRTDYDKFKSSYDKAISSGNYTGANNSFPEYDDWYENRTKASINGNLVSASDLEQGSFDVDQLNLIMQLMEMKNGNK